jgi:YidC/Oxa1 family membrane protein insertase
MIGLITQAFNVILYQPLFNSLILLYQFLPGNDFGMAVIVLTILIRLILFPLMNQSLKAQKALSGIQEKVKDIQKRYKEDKEREVKEIMALYRKEKINPYASFLPLIIQILLLIALYRVFWRGLEPEALDFLYAFVPRPETIDPFFLNLLDLSRPNLAMAIIAGICQFFQSKQLSSKSERKADNKFTEIISNQMLYFFPIFTTLILLKIPSAVALYWIVSILFSIAQQHFIQKSKI